MGVRNPSVGLVTGRDNHKTYGLQGNDRDVENVLREHDVKFAKVRTEEKFINAYLFDVNPLTPSLPAILKSFELTELEEINAIPDDFKHILLTDREIQDRNQYERRDNNRRDNRGHWSDRGDRGGYRDRRGGDDGRDRRGGDDGRRGNNNRGGFMKKSSGYQNRRGDRDYYQ